MYVLGSRDDKFAFVKTEGESGYFLPQEFKHIVREYFEEDENLAYGFDQEEEDENGNYLKNWRKLTLSRPRRG